ncbi:MAG: hypothetical protein AAB354_13925 [candidate division KSB1 bacterium]
MKATNKIKTKLASFMLLVTVMTSLAGCVAHRHRHAQVVVIEAGHAHSEHCGHYRHGNRWYFVKSHRHGQRCGHHFVGGVWIIK